MNVFEPIDPFLKKYVDTIYLFEKEQKDVKYTSYPSHNTSVGLLRNAVVEFSGDDVIVTRSNVPNHFGMALNRLFRTVHMHYVQMIDEIAINFKPIGFSAFAQCRNLDSDNDRIVFTSWDSFLPDLFTNVFATTVPSEQIAIIESFLLSRYRQFEDEEMLFEACALLADIENDHKIQEVASCSGVHPKYLYRSSMQHIGCSPAHFRKIVRFRNAVYSKLDKGDALRFIELCYSNNYTDQPYFNKQFQEITGESPKKFFRDVSAFGKVVFKFS